MTDRETARTNADSTIRMIKGYLQAMEDRDLAGAASFLSDDFQMHFPGDQTFHTLDELVSWARPRYQWVKKAYEQFDSVPPVMRTLFTVSVPCTANGRMAQTLETFASSIGSS